MTFGVSYFFYSMVINGLSISISQSKATISLHIIIKRWAFRILRFQLPCSFRLSRDCAAFYCWSFGKNYVHDFFSKYCQILSLFSHGMCAHVLLHHLKNAHHKDLQHTSAILSAAWFHHDLRRCSSWIFSSWFWTRLMFKTTYYIFWIHGRWKDFAQERDKSGVFKRWPKRFFIGAKVMKFLFTHTKIRKQLLLLKFNRKMSNFKTHGGVPPSDTHVWMFDIPLIYFNFLSSSGLGIFSFCLSSYTFTVMIIFQPCSGPHGQIYQKQSST